VGMGADFKGLDTQQVLLAYRQSSRRAILLDWGGTGASFLLLQFISGGGALSLAGANAIELTESNFDAEVFDSGKNAFVKFLAPW